MWILMEEGQFPETACIARNTSGGQVPGWRLSRSKPAARHCGGLRVILPSEFRRTFYQALGDKALVIWQMRPCGLVTAGECGSGLNAVRHVDEKKELGNRQSHGPGSAAVPLAVAAVVVALIRGDCE